MDRLIIGEVLKPQGIRGELKIKTFTDFPEDVKEFGTVYIDDKPYKILSYRVGSDGAAYIGLRGIPDRNAAELFRGKKLEGDREDAPPLEEGRHYIVDILGLNCETEEGEFLGVVKHIVNLAALHHSATVHHRHAVTKLRDDAKIMGNEQNAHPHILFHFLQQLQNTS